jgi:hypothetical protein
MTARRLTPLWPEAFIFAQCITKRAAPGTVAPYPALPQTLGLHGTSVRPRWVGGSWALGVFTRPGDETIPRTNIFQGANRGDLEHDDDNQRDQDCHVAAIGPHLRRLSLYEGKRKRVHGIPS